MKLTWIEIANFCRNLAVLLHGGIGISDGVFLLCQEEDSQLLKQLSKQMDEGERLSAAMEKTGAFPGCVTGMVSVGEQTGHLEEVLEALARFYEQRSRSGRQIKNALVYPAVILVLMLVVLGVLLIQVLPVFDDVYASLGSGLTGAAAILLRLGRWLKGAMPVLFVLLGLLILMGVLYSNCRTVREKVNGWFTARFGDRGVSRKYNNANFARALSMGLASGMPLEDAAELAGKLLEDTPAAAQRCCQCSVLLRDGAPLADAMKECGFLAAAESRMLIIGMRQGSGDRVMANIADRLMEQADEALENTVAKIEPAMVLIASVLVGAIMLSVMLPLMNIMAAIG